MRTLAALLLVPLLLANAFAQEQEDDYSAHLAGRVVDADGRPVAGASVGLNWSSVGGPVPETSGAITSGDDGTFSGTTDVYGYPARVAAYSADGALAGFTSVAEGQTGDVLITLRPSLTVTLRVTRTGLEEPLPYAGVNLTVAGGMDLSAQLQGTDALELVVPHGDLSWFVYDDWFSTVKGERAVEPDEFAVDLGALDIPPAFLARHVGKVLPEWTVTDARNLLLDQATLAAHRGKWLLIEFWGFW